MRRAVARGFSPNAFRKFSVVSFPVYFLHLYESHEIDMYSGNATPFPVSISSSPRHMPPRGAAGRIPGRMGRLAGRRVSGGAGPTRSQAARPIDPGVARPYLSRDEGGRHVGRALCGVVRGATGRQFAGGSPRAIAVGDLCRVDAPDAAAARHSRGRTGGLLAWVAPGRARRDAVHADECAADQAAGHQSAHAPRPCGVREAADGGVARVGSAQSNRGRGRRARRSGVRPGFDPAARDPRAGTGPCGPVVRVRRVCGVLARGVRARGLAALVLRPRLTGS